MTEKIVKFVPDATVDQRLQMSAAALHQKVVDYCTGKDLTPHIIERVRELVRFHVWRARRVDGIDFPDMVIMPFPAIGYINLCRADTELPGLAVILKNVTSNYPSVAAKDLAFAVSYAFPHLAQQLQASPGAYKKAKHVL